ncbi:MAG: class I SAM-dependent methyltransferase [Thermoanaerobaculia bacterium]|nr:class I SAM-dependent methyltransferase [Thermoanaerobaculia bacterium]
MALPLHLLRWPDEPRERLALEGGRLTCGGRVAASWKPDERRLAWRISLPDELARRVEGERRKFDRVARELRSSLRREPDGPWHRSPWLLPREIEPLLESHPELAEVAGRTVLDLGGTSPIAWRFVRSGASLHQVDVSPETQRVALARLELQEADTGAVWLHTAPAERLPFRDGVFDLVFSRHSVHHLARPEAFDEIRRVLRPDGYLVAFEPWMRLPMRLLMRLSRRLRGVDRGTDDPLGPRDRVELARRFGLVDLRPTGIATPLAGRVARRATWLSPWVLRLTRLEARIGTLPGPGRHLATRAVLVARGEAAEPPAAVGRGPATRGGAGRPRPGPPPPPRPGS